MPKRVTALLFALMLLVGGVAQAGDLPESIMAGLASANRDLIMLAVVLGVLALGGGFALLHHLSEKRVRGQ